MESSLSPVVPCIVHTVIYEEILYLFFVFFYTHNGISDLYRQPEDHTMDLLIKADALLSVFTADLCSFRFLNDAERECNAAVQ